MRTLLLFSLLFFALVGYGQDDAWPQSDTIFTSMDWVEVSTGDREGYILRLTEEGNFEEDAGERHNRPYRYLMGRWKVDSNRTTFTLSVDGQMGKTGVNRRYLKGRDYYLVYDLVSLENGKMKLKDRLTRKIRTFEAKERKDYVEPAMRRLPVPGKKPGGLELPGGLKLPGGWGGLTPATAL